MPGPAPKHQSVRNRRNKGTAGFRTLAAVPAAPPPPWPLAADAELAARREQLRDKVAAAQCAVVEDSALDRGRAATPTERSRRSRLRRRLDSDQIALAILEAQIEQVMDGEAGIWAEMWSAPQATIWAENPATVREVAQYCRLMLRAAQGDIKASAEARQLSDRLGINPLALLKLRAEIEHADEVEDRGRRRRERAHPTAEGKPNGDDPRGGLFAV